MKIPILFVSWCGELGGAEISLLRFIRRLDRDRFLPYALLFQNGNFRQELEALNIPVELVVLKRFRYALLNPFLLCKVTCLLKKNSIRLIHANGTLSYLAVYAAAQLTHVPLLWHLVDMPQRTDRSERLAGRLKADFIFCNSRATQQAFTENYPGNPSPRKVLYPQIEIERAETDPASTKKHLGIPDDHQVVLSIGRFQQWKGQETLIRAIPRVLLKFPKTAFVFMGAILPGMDEGYRNELQALAQSLKVTDHCLFIDFQNKAGDFYAISDVVVHTSLRPEPFGMVIPEAMLHGKAVIASNQGGPAEMIRHEQTGWLVRPGQDALLADALYKLLGSPELRRKVGTDAKAWALHYLDPDETARATEMGYLKMLGKTA